MLSLPRPFPFLRPFSFFRSVPLAAQAPAILFTLLLVFSFPAFSFAASKAREDGACTLARGLETAVQTANDQAALIAHQTKPVLETLSTLAAKVDDPDRPVDDQLSGEDLAAYKTASDELRRLTFLNAFQSARKRDMEMLAALAAISEMMVIERSRYAAIHGNLDGFIKEFREKELDAEIAQYLPAYFFLAEQFPSQMEKAFGGNGQKKKDSR